MADVTPAAGTCSELGPRPIAGMAVGAGWYGGGASEPSPVLAGALWGTQWQQYPLKCSLMREVAGQM